MLGALTEGGLSGLTLREGREVAGFVGGRISNAKARFEFVRRMEGAETLTEKGLLGRVSSGEWRRCCTLPKRWGKTEGPNRRPNRGKAPNRGKWIDWTGSGVEGVCGVFSTRVGLGTRRKITCSVAAFRWERSRAGGVCCGSVVALVEYFEPGCADGGDRVGACVCEMRRSRGDGRGNYGAWVGGLADLHRGPVAGWTDECSARGCRRVWVSVAATAFFSPK